MWWEFFSPHLIKNNMPSIFVISDTWFNRLLVDDPNVNVVDNNEHIIQVWNETVEPGDKVYVLGGFGIGDLYHIITKLNGEIHILANYFNADEYMFIENMRTEINNSVDPEFKSRIIFENSQIQVLPEVDAVLSYFPLETWCGKSTGTYLFHGFTQNTDLVDHNISCVASKWQNRPINITKVQGNIDVFNNVLGS